MTSLLLIVFLAYVLTRQFLRRNMPRVGGKLGSSRDIVPAVPVPDGFSRVDSRAVTIFAAASEAARFPNLKSYLRHGTVRQPTLVRIYHVAGCRTRIEIPVAAPDYERIDAAEALALLRELPDPRLVRRLHLSDQPCFLDPWMRKVSGREVYHLGHATSNGLIVIYRPDRRLGAELGVTLLHEWLHLVGFKWPRSVRRFRRASAIERLAPMSFEPVSLGDRKTPVYEAWSDLGEKLCGYDGEIARQAALAAPVHSMILWRRVEKILRAVPPRLRSTRFAELEAHAAFMQKEVEPKARASQRRRWMRLWQIE
jgi:hypothetical protein